MVKRIDMLAKGLLPENLPPIFSSRKLIGIDNLKDLRGYVLSKKEKKTFEPVVFNASKRGHQRRKFSIPNVVAAMDICFFVEKHWAEIGSFIEKSPFSASVPKVSDGGRSLELATHKELTQRRFSLLSGCKYIVKTDTSRFYPSIYTHSLPWAFHGKRPSKLDRDILSQGVFFNRADWLCRLAQDGQTIGIPVGPDYSRVFGEVISCAVDQEFMARYGANENRSISAIRYIDDMWIGADSLDEANRFLHGYRECLRSFELDINELKTRIVVGTESSLDFWPIETKELLQTAFEQHSSDVERQLYSLEKIIGIALRENDDAIIKYTIRKLDGLLVWHKKWDVLEPFLMKSAVHFPHSIDYVARVVVWKNRIGNNFDKTVWNSVFSSALAQHADVGNDSEVCWILWTLRELKTAIPSKIAEIIFMRCGPLPAAILMLNLEQGLITGAPDLGYLREKLSNKGLLGNYWSLGHEAKIRGWFTRGARASWDTHEVHSIIIRKDMTFLNEEAVPVVFENVEEGKWSAEVPNAIEDLFDSYDDVEEDELLEADPDLPF